MMPSLEAKATTILPLYMLSQRFTTRSAALRWRCFSTAAGSDFAHHKPGVARLNHASFGAVPKPVLKAQDDFRASWLAQPDEWYFSGDLHQGIREAAQKAGTLLSKTRQLDEDHVCLVENATVATSAVAHRWSKMIQPGDVVLHFDISYKACIHVLKEYCESRGATLVPLSIPFDATRPEEIVASLKSQVEQLSKKPRFAFFDHITSQPAILLPIQEICAVAREHGSSDMEICVDAAHAVGSVVDLEIPDCDFYFSNLHKWAFCPSSATILWSPLLPEMRHPIVSWAWGEGMAEESLFPGTRDFSAYFAVPAAVGYLMRWQSSSDGKTAQEYCHDRVMQAATKLRRDWNVNQPNLCDSDLVATQAMVRLPSELEVLDVPGQVSRGLRDVLRKNYDIEAAIGNFGKQHGAYIRLSYAVYNDDGDIQRLSDAIIEQVEMG